MRLYYVTISGGLCGLVSAKSVTQARAQALREHGYSNVYDVRRATEGDVNWIATMGGRVPDGECDAER